MQVPFLDLRSQYDEVKDRVDSSIREIFESSAFVLGKHNNELEERLAELHGVRYGVAVNSGTDALRIALQAAGVGPGDEVITTAFTFVASVEVIVQLGARPVFVDIDERCFDLDAGQIESKITDKTKAIVPIHLFGQLSDVAAIEEIAKRRNLIVIEDAAQAIMNTFDGRSAGQFGLAAAFSFYVTKNLGAAGDGGIILTDSEDIYVASRSLRVHGMGRERYYYDDIGYTSRMAEIQAAVLCAKLDRLDAWHQHRQTMAEVYDELLAGSDVLTPKVRTGNNHTYHQYTILAPRRDELMAFLQGRGIGCGIYYPIPLHLHDPYREFGGGDGSLPITEKVSLECLSLPIHQHIKREQVEYVAEQIKQFYAQ